MFSSYQTIVIGLGAAGTTAATTLAASGVRVLALEAQSYIGGRVHTVAFGDGVVELGAEWIHGSERSRVYEAAVANNITVLAQDLPLEIYHSNGVKPNQSYQDTFNELVEFVFLTADQPSDEPEPLGSYCERKLNEYLHEHKPELWQNKELIAQVLNFSNQLMNNYNASNDWNDVNAQGKFDQLEGHQHFSWHRHGYKTFFDILLKPVSRFPTLDIKLEKEVISIEWSQENAPGVSEPGPKPKVVVRCKDGSTYSADNVIVTVSLGVLKERYPTLFHPKLPDDKINAIQNMAMGVMDKIQIAFNKIWWPTDGATFFGFIWKEEDRNRVEKKDLWVTKVFAASRTMGASNVLTLWTSGDVGKQVEILPIDEVKKKSIHLLQRFMGDSMGIKVPAPIAIERSTWFSNQFTRGSYSYDNMATAGLPTLRADLARPLLDGTGQPRVLFAGEATDETHYSTVHGAADSGYREAMRLLHRSSKL